MESLTDLIKSGEEIIVRGNKIIREGRLITILECLTAILACQTGLKWLAILNISLAIVVMGLTQYIQYLNRELRVNVEILKDARKSIHRSDPPPNS